MANSPSGESIIGRFVKIVSAFDDGHTSMSVAELGRRTGLPVTTTYRLVNDLLLERLLEREPGGDIHIGTRMWELVSRGSKMLGLREAALPFMEDVQAVVQHSTTLGILDSDEVLYIERLGSDKTIVDITKIAGRLPIHATSSGLVLLAYSPRGLPGHHPGPSPDEVHRNHPDRSRPAAPPPGRDQAARLRCDARRDRAGVQRHRGPRLRPGQHRPSPPSAWWCRATRRTSAARVPVLMAAARGISRALGWRGELKGTLRQSH